MLDIYQGLLQPSPATRMDAEAFLDEGLRPKGFFMLDFVQVNLFLENISIKEQGEKEGFFRLGLSILFQKGSIYSRYAFFIPLENWIL